MYLNHHSPMNAGVLCAFLSKKGGSGDIEIGPADENNGYMHSGCHPEVVERVWDQIGTALPVDCRCMVGGTPALVAPRSGIVLAVAWGTRYILRLTDEAMPLAINAGARTTTKWTFGGSMDVTKEFGNNWVFGHWLKEEPGWCRAMYEGVEKAAGN